jgi:hypothetical protein
MRIRAKIAFTALEKRMTVYELFIRTIKNSYLELQKLGYYKGRGIQEN